MSMSHRGATDHEHEHVSSDTKQYNRQACQWLQYPSLKVSQVQIDSLFELDILQGFYVPNLVVCDAD